MHKKPKHRKAMTLKEQFAYESEILDLIDNRDEFTRSDLQGIVSALVMKIQSSK